MMFNYKRILVLGAHTDDGELGCGGSIAKFIAEGKSVYYVAFACASLPEGWPADTLKKEIRSAAHVLGIPHSQVSVLDYPVREFPRLRQEILDDMVKLKRQIEPDLVFLPSVHDTHQDHEIIAREGFRAFKHSTMLGYELPWNHQTYKGDTFVLLDEEHIQKKLDAVSCYQSQKHRYYFCEEFIRGWAATRGIQVAHKYAEVFDTVRWILP
jgi:LmbE family N-acetylglucosaminyl deacetylase